MLSILISKLLFLPCYYSYIYICNPYNTELFVFLYIYYIFPIAKAIYITLNLCKFPLYYQPYSTKLNPLTGSTCSLPSVKGPCRGYFPRYYFNSKTGKCTRFIYGGCRGNRNNFRTLANCKAKCGGGSSSGELM